MAGVMYLGNQVISPVIIQGGGEPERKYGASINDVLGDVDENGMLQPISSDNEFSLVFDNAVSINSNTLAYKFYGSGVTSVSFPELTSISRNYACYCAFRSCPKLVSISFPKLKTVTGFRATSVCDNMFFNCGRLTSVSLPELVTISGSNACASMFSNCYDVSSISLPKLKTISGSNACASMFSSCRGLTSVSFPELETINGDLACEGMFNGLDMNLESLSFPKLKTTSFGSYTNQFTNIIELVSSVTIHFPSNLESVISGLTGYPNFGGTNTTIAFDLPATS